MSDVMLEIRRALPYVVNLKFGAGLLFCLYALYAGFTELPGKWTNYQKVLETNKQLQESKNSLSTEDARLKAISTELDKLKTKILEVGKDVSPELAAINAAQKVVKLCESSNNTYLGLTPNGKVEVNIDKSVTLPINLPGAGGAAPAAGGDSAQGSGGAAAAAGGPGIAVNGYSYTLSSRGSYANVATFIHNLSQMPELVMLNSINLAPLTGGVAAGNPDEIEMRIDFVLPMTSASK